MCVCVCVCVCECMCECMCVGEVYPAYCTGRGGTLSL